MKKKVILFAILSILTLPVVAQLPPGGDCDPDDPEDFRCLDGDEEVPLDDLNYLLPSGIILGIAGVAAYKNNSPATADYVDL